MGQKDIERTFKDPKPQSFVKEYDYAIKMLEMSASEEVLLTGHDFAQLVMDDWSWRNSWRLTASKYSSRVSEPDPDFDAYS